jgi:adenylate cyclase
VNDSSPKKRLSAILVADAVGFSRLMSQDEDETIAALDEARAVFRREIAAQDGRIIDMAGDSVLALFSSAAGALTAALAVQESLVQAADQLPSQTQLHFRVGLHLGDVIEKIDGTAYGDGINTAARLQTVGRPGCVIGSDAVKAAVRGMAGVEWEDLGELQFKNLSSPVRVFATCARGLASRNSPLVERRTLGRRYLFGDNEVILDERRLLVRGEPVAIGARAFDLMLLLIAHRDRVVTKAEMLEHVWPGMVVEESNLTVHVSALRKVLGAQSLATVAGRGYRFVMPLEVKEPTPVQSPAGPQAQPVERASLAVLPFVNMSDDPLQEHFADGLVEDIITTLSKISGIAVIARNSSVAYKGRSVDVRQVARELGVSHVLEGSVRKGGSQIRITAQLIDASSGAHIWAERYDRTLQDVFTVQDEITLMLATELQVQLTEGEQTRLRYSTAHNFEAWSHWVRGLAHYRRADLTPDGMAPALASWQLADTLDPRSASLNAMLGLLHYLDARFGFWSSKEAAIEQGNVRVARALSLDPQHPDAHMTRSLLLLLQRQHAQAVAAARQSLQYGPNAADNAAFAAFVFADAGLAEEAVSLMHRAIKLCPIHPPFYLGHLGKAYRQSRRLEEATSAFEAYHRLSPGRGLVDLVILCRQRGQAEEARRWASVLLASDPKFRIGAWAETQFCSDRAGLDADTAALRAAGLPG